MKNIEKLNGIQGLSNNELENTNGGYSAACAFVGAAVISSFVQGVIEGIAEA